MKKFWFRLAVWFAGLIAVAWGNNAVLLHFHSLEYYYTPSGLLLTTAVIAVEAIVLWPLYGKIYENWVSAALHEGLEEEKEGIITEFKEN